MAPPNFSSFYFNNPNLSNPGVASQFLYDSVLNNNNGGWRATTADDVRGNRTTFNEIISATNNSVFTVKPTWGVSELRDTVYPTGALGVTEVSGELKLVTVPLSSNNNYCQIQTLNRGQYVPGSIGEVGVGIRIPVAPTGDQEAMWGYYDSQNGFGFGANRSGVYTFYRTSAVTTKTYQPAWNTNTLMTGGVNRPLTLSDGNIFQVRFGWYGYSTIEYDILTYNSSNLQRSLTPVNKLDIFGSMSIADPNQPITVTITGGASDDQFAVYLGGRKMSLIGGELNTNFRPVREIISNFTITAAQNVWQPIMAMHVEPTHGPSNRSNSVQVIYRGFEAASDNPTQMMVTFGGTITGTPDWGAPTLWTPEETATLTRVAGSLTGVITGYPINYALLPTSNQARVSLNEVDENLPLGQTTEVILWTRRTSSSATTVSAVLRWDEQW